MTDPHRTRAEHAGLMAASRKIPSDEVSPAVRRAVEAGIDAALDAYATPPSFELAEGEVDPKTASRLAVPRVIIESNHATGLDPVPTDDYRAQLAPGRTEIGDTGETPSEQMMRMVRGEPPPVERFEVGDVTIVGRARPSPEEVATAEQGVRERAAASRTPGRDVTARTRAGNLVRGTLVGTDRVDTGHGEPVEVVPGSVLGV